MSIANAPASTAAGTELTSSGTFPSTGTGGAAAVPTDSPAPARPSRPARPAGPGQPAQQDQERPPAAEQTVLRGVYHLRIGSPATLRDYLNDVRPLTRWDGDLVVVLPPEPAVAPRPTATDTSVPSVGPGTEVIDRLCLLLACGLGPRTLLVRRSALDGQACLERLLTKLLHGEALPVEAADLLLLRADLLFVPSGNGHSSPGSRAADDPPHTPARMLAGSFNDRYPPVFPLPTLMRTDHLAPVPAPAVPVAPPPGDVGALGLLDSPTRIAAVVRETRTDLDPRLSYDPDLRHGVSHLAEVLGSLTDRRPGAALTGLRGTARLKAEVTQAVICELRPIQQRYQQLRADPAPVYERLEQDTAATGELVVRTLDAVRAAMA